MFFINGALGKLRTFMSFPDVAEFRTCTHRLCLWACLFLFAPQIGWAAGTTAGTSISNSATLTYAIGAGPATTATSNTVYFTVDEKVNLTVAGTGVAIPVLPGASTQVATFTVTNNSNSPLDFSLAANQPVGGTYLTLTDNFDALGCITRVESNPVPDGYQAATDIGTFVDELAADGTATVYEVCDIPSGQNNGDAAIVGLTATARGTFNTLGYIATSGSLNPTTPAEAVATGTSIGILLADPAGSEGDGTSDAQDSARDVYSVVNGVNVTLTKTVPSIVDPNGTGVVMPNAVMTYQIAVDLTGSGTATNLVITDPIPANTTYLANSITLDGAPQTDAVDPGTDNTDFGITNANTVTVSLGNVAAPATHVITFKATIN
jgi:uncharacterized repeat protein (TIGR01451 family)